MIKRKKNVLATQQPNLIAVPQSDSAERDLLMDSLGKTLSHFGFQQVTPSPVEERKSFFQAAPLEKHFGDKFVELAGAGPRELVLPPTHFLSVFRRYFANVQNRGPHVAKWFYLAPVLELLDREPVTSHELGVFILGENSGIANAQLINTITQLFTSLGVKDFLTEVNSVGCSVCQKDYQNVLQDHLRRVNFELCANCAADLERDPMAVWSCSEAACQSLLVQAPQIVDFLDEECRTTLVGVLETVDALGIPYTLNPGLSPRLLRQQVVFRVTAEEGKRVLGFGGNYAPLSPALQVPEQIPVLGFVTTFEKLWETIPSENRKIIAHVEVFMVPLGEVACRRALLLHRELQHAGIVAAEAMLGNSGIKNQLKAAIDQHSEIALIIGQKEALDETVILRDMRSGMQEVFASERIIEEVKKRLGK